MVSQGSPRPPRFLSLARVVELHREGIEHYGGDPSLRDAGLLESAIAQPRATYGGEFLHGDLAEMAAAYLFHLVMNHPFVDGNKRVGAFAARVFLFMNDVSFEPPEEAYEAITLAVASGQASKEQVVAFFRQHVKGS